MKLILYWIILITCYVCIRFVSFAMRFSRRKFRGFGNMTRKGLVSAKVMTRDNKMKGVERKSLGTSSVVFLSRAVDRGRLSPAQTTDSSCLTLWTTVSTTHPFSFKDFSAKEQKKKKISTELGRGTTLVSFELKRLNELNLVEE